MEGLTMDNILSETEAEALFSFEDNDETQDTSPEKEETKEETTTEGIDSETIFEESSESVGSEENIEEKEDTTSDNTGTSPNKNFYSSIAKALKEDGVFPDLEDSTLESIKEAEDLASVIEAQVNNRLDEKQKRIEVALNAGVEDSVIKSYENTIAFLDSITEDALKEEGEKAESLRKQLIYQDLRNKGLTEEEAKEDLQEILDNGTDIRKAIRALASNKDFFQKGYQQVIEDAEEEAANAENERKQMAADLKKSILEEKKVFGDIELDRATRQKVYDNISKPVYKDKETGELFTAIQKYEMENKKEFLKNVGLIFTLTDGFKNLDGLVKSKVNKEVKKGLRELEHTLNNTTRTSNGNLVFVSGVGSDPESKVSKWDLDV